MKRRRMDMKEKNEALLPRCNDETREESGG